MKYEDMSEWMLCQLMHNQIKCNGFFDISFSDGKVTLKAVNPELKIEEISFSINEAKSNVDNYMLPEIIMPIAIEYGFSIEIPDDNLGRVGTITKYIEGARDIQVDYEDKENPYRAIAICFLKMMDAMNA